MATIAKVFLLILVNISAVTFLCFGQFDAKLNNQNSTHSAKENANHSNIQLNSHSSAQMYREPPDSSYVIIKDGHLSYQSKRIRFWGTVGNFPGKNHEDNEAVVLRLKAMGFNLVRFWIEPVDDGNYVKGDGSRMDLVDHFLWCCEKQGIRIWYAGLNNLGKATITDSKVIDDSLSESTWRTAISENGMEIRDNPARIWDSRLHQLGIERMKAIANHVNKYNNLRYADDPNFAIWELSNEEWWFGRVISRFSGLPALFQKELVDEWNRFLQKKYSDSATIAKAWLGLLACESFNEKSILLLPLRSSIEPNKQRKALGVNIQEGINLQYSVDDFNRQRGSDVIEFLLSKWIKHKREENDILKAFGKSIRLGSLIWDTGIGHEIQAQFMQQQADAITHCTYISGFHHDPAHKRFPWFSGLEELPRLSWDNSWLEQNKMEGKPFFVYENQIHNPAKYRAEYPLRLASLGSIQDWDVIVWHLFGPAPDATKKEPYNNVMYYTKAGSNNPDGFHFEFDEVQMSAMKAAGAIFINGLLMPASHPTTFIFGKKSLLNPASFNNVSYGDKYRLFVPTTYRYGMRLLIDSSKKEDEIIGPVYRERVYEINPITPTEQIEYDWQKGHLKFDAPGVAMYTGFAAQTGLPIKFKNGVVLQSMSIINDPGIVYPVSNNEKYIELSIVSDDGMPLHVSKKVMISAVSTSFNSGFKLDHSKLIKEFGWHFQENAGATLSIGKAPVLVARVQAELLVPMFTGMKYKMLDWHLRELKTGVIENGRLEISGKMPIFIIELNR